jgi:hypothetical protein
MTPFLAERIWDRESFPIKLAECSHCGFAFFNPRLEAGEEKRLYAEYRGEGYQQMRFRHEPWYTESFNRQLSAEEVMVFRRQLLASILAKYANPGAVRSVLDFGGDGGQLIQDMPASSKYVYDISGVPKRNGIIGLNAFSDCRARSYDLVVCSNVLEHVSFPKQIVSQITQLASSSTLIYLDVPLESPLSPSSVFKRMCQTLVLCGLRIRDALTLLRPGMFYLMHEHVNFFSVKSLSALAESMGIRVVATGRYDMGKAMLLGGNCIWCLGRVEETRAQG